MTLFLIVAAVWECCLIRGGVYATGVDVVGGHFQQRGHGHTSIESLFRVSIPKHCLCSECAWNKSQIPDIEGVE